MSIAQSDPCARGETYGCEHFAKASAQVAILPYALANPNFELRPHSAATGSREGDPSGAFPRLADQSAWYLYNSLRDFASGLRPSEVMGPIAAELRDDQMLEVAAYYASLEGVRYPTELRHDEQLMKQGEQIATSGLPDEAGVPACSPCHGDQALGSAPLYPFLAGQYRPYLGASTEAVQSGAARRRSAERHARHRRQTVGSADRSRAAYFASLRPERTTPGEAARRTARIVPPSLCR
jgi:cytochrome c553